MPVWSQARHAARQALAGALAERAAPGGSNVVIPRAAERWAAQVCVYCGGKAGRKVGKLPITGNVIFCKNHAEQYQDDKKWEAKYKKEMGLK